MLHTHKVSQRWEIYGLAYIITTDVDFDHAGFEYVLVTDIGNMYDLECNQFCACTLFEMYCEVDLDPQCS